MSPKRNSSDQRACRGLSQSQSQLFETVPVVQEETTTTQTFIVEKKSKWLNLPISIDESAITVTESRFCSPGQISHATKALKSGLETNSKMHKVSSSIIGAMRLNYGGNWFCNIRSRADQMGVRFHGRKEGIFMSFSHGSTTYRVQINQL